MVLLPYTDRHVAVFYCLLSLFPHNSPVDTHHHPTYLPAAVGACCRRDQLVEDGFNEIGRMDPDRVKGRLRIQYVNEAGLAEAGIDGGGLFKDFMEELLRQGFSPQVRVFLKQEAGGEGCKGLLFMLLPCPRACACTCWCAAVCTVTRTEVSGWQRGRHAESRPETPAVSGMRQF